MTDLTDTIILTTTHAASSYGVPVLVIDGEAYGPADMTPAGIIAADLVQEWAARFEEPHNPGRRLEDDEARLEAQGYEDWLRTDPGRRLDDHEARLRRLEDWVEGTVYPNRQAQAGDRPTDTA